MRRPGRGAFMLACATGLLLAIGAAPAQPVPDRSVDEYRNAARRALHACRKAVPDTGPLVRVGDRGWAECAAEARSLIARKFDAAMASTMDPVLRAALQRHQAAFFVSLAGLAPLPGEAANGYRQRQTGLHCALSHAWTDVERSEADDWLGSVKTKP